MTRPRDLEIMQLADGELAPAEAARVEAALDDDGRAKLAALRETGQAVRGHLELRADEADARLSRMWDEVAKQIALPAPARAAKPAKPGLWTRFASWLDDHRGHVFTGLVSAGAVAAIMLWLRPAGSTTTVFRPEDNGSGIQPASLKRQAPQVESLDTPEGTTGNVFIEDDDGSGTAVILVTPNDVEGT